MRGSRDGRLPGALLLVLGLLGCATTVPVGERPLVEGAVEAPGFTAGVPSGPGWGVRVDLAGDTVEFGQSRLAPDGRLVWLFRVAVSTGGGVPADVPLRSEEERAAELLAEEERRERGAGGARPIRVVGRDVEAIGGKRLHALRWEWQEHDFLVTWDGRATSYLYFPPEKDGRVWFVFRVVELRERHNPYAPGFDPRRAYPVIEGFRPR
jgi:hypothetical protein